MMSRAIIPLLVSGYLAAAGIWEALPDEHLGLP